MAILLDGERVVPYQVGSLCSLCDLGTKFLYTFIDFELNPIGTTGDFSHMLYTDIEA